MDRIRVLVTCALVGLGIVARADQVKRPPRPTLPPRYHVLSQHFARHLAKKTKLSIDSIGEMNHASVFIVHQDPVSGHALALTNEHVVRNGLPTNTSVNFFEGGRGKSVRVLATNQALDYALVEIENSTGPIRPALRIETEGMVRGRPVYSIAAYAHLGFKKPQLALGGGPQANLLVMNTYVNRWAIANGHVSHDDYLLQKVRTGNIDVTGIISVLPNSSGMSGSPVFASDTHAVVGLHSSGNGGPQPVWEQTSVPMGLILSDLSTKLAFGQLDAESARLVKGLFATHAY